MTNHTKNQHYVPQFLLRNFSSGKKNLIWCFDKLKKKSSERSIRKIAMEEYFYDTKVGQKEHSFEYLFSKAESAAAPIIHKLVKSQDLKTLSMDDFGIATLFIAAQILRTKSALIETERMDKELQKLLEPWRLDGSLKLDYTQHTPREVWMSLFSSTPEFAAILLNKVFFLIGSDKAFYTSDNPVVLKNRADQRVNRGTLGINSDGIELYFPISDSLVLCLLCERTYGYMEGKEMPDDFITGEDLNALQVIQSDRYVFSSSDCFDFVSS